MDPVCPLCSSCAEDNAHLFMYCDFAKMVWFSSPLGIHVPLELDVNDWLLHWLSCKNHFAIQVFCTTLWKIWYARNQSLFKNQKPEPHVTAADGLDFVLEFNKASPCKKVLRQQNPAAENDPVYRGFNVIQVDAGCYVNDLVALGCVIKNQADDVILSASNRESIAADPATAEALAIRWSLQKTQELNLDRVLVQSDALVVVDCLNDINFSAALEPLISYCKLIMSSFSQCTVMFISRNLNLDAHHMVGVGNLVGSKTWMDLISRNGVDIHCNAPVVFNE